MTTTATEADHASSFRALTSSVAERMVQITHEIEDLIDELEPPPAGEVPEIAEPLAGQMHALRRLRDQLAARRARQVGDAHPAEMMGDYLERARRHLDRIEAAAKAAPVDAAIAEEFLRAVWQLDAVERRATP